MIKYERVDEIIMTLKGYGEKAKNSSLLSLQSLKSLKLFKEAPSQKGIDNSKIKNTDKDLTYSDILEIIKSTISHVKTSKNTNIEHMRSFISELVFKLSQSQQIFTFLQDLKSKDKYTYSHSIRTCIYSLAIGTHLGMSKKDLVTLGAGSILHDIGKCKIPSEILLKPEALTTEEFEIMKQHSKYGYDILINSGFSNSIANLALQHHEKWNGISTRAVRKPNRFIFKNLYNYRYI